MFVIEARVGRLIEIRVPAELSIDEIDDFARRFARLIEGRRLVACVDVRGLVPMQPAVAAAYTQVMRRNNLALDRVALRFDDTQAELLVQLAGFIRDAGNPSRRVFTDADELEAWLAEVLTPDEHARLREFLAP